MSKSPLEHLRSEKSIGSSLHRQESQNMPCVSYTSMKYDTYKKLNIFYSNYNKKIGMRKHMMFEPPNEANKKLENLSASPPHKGWGKISDIILNEDTDTFRKIIFQMRPDLVDKLFGRRKVMIHKVSLLQAKIKALPRNMQKKNKGTPKRKRKNSVNVIDKLLKAALINKISKVNKQVFNSTQKVPELLTFKSFKSKLTQNFDQFKPHRHKRMRKVSHLKEENTYDSSELDALILGNSPVKEEGRNYLSYSPGSPERLVNQKLGPRINQSVISKRYEPQLRNFRSPLPKSRKYIKTPNPNSDLKELTAPKLRFTEGNRKKINSPIARNLIKLNPRGKPREALSPIKNFRPILSPRGLEGEKTPLFRSPPISKPIALATSLPVSPPQTAQGFGRQGQTRRRCRGRNLRRNLAKKMGQTISLHTAVNFY